MQHTTKSLVAITQLLAVVWGQPLEVVITNTHLPSTRTNPRTAYDGDDTIYVWHGEYDTTYGGIRTDILKYSISLGKLETIGEKGGFGIGSGGWTGNQTMLNFGGVTPNKECLDEIWSFRTTNPSEWTLAGTLVEEAYYSTSAWDGEDNTYIIGGIRISEYLATISKYSSEDNSVKIVGNLPSGTIWTSAFWENSERNLYILGGRDLYANFYNDIFKFDPLTEELTKVNTLPIKSAKSCAIWTGAVAYIIGGRTTYYEDTPKVVRFDPFTNEVSVVPVNNFPDKLHGVGCAFVEKLNRVYLFGGETLDPVNYRNEIMYIDLGPPPVTTTTEPSTTEPSTTEPSTTEPSTTEKPEYPNVCEGQDDYSLVPNPFCCESYYQCLNEQSTRHQCPDRFHFNPVTGGCEFMDTVECFINYGKKYLDKIIRS